MKKFNAAVWGAGGYVGKELTSILSDHPHIGEIYAVSTSHTDATDSADIAFLALPHGSSAPVAELLQATQPHTTVIDLSGDLRFKNPQTYEEWYQMAHPAPDVLEQGVPYCLPELFPIPKEAGIYSMPGCYPTASLLSTVPLIEAGIVKPSTQIDVDAVSGVSGLGKNFPQGAELVMKLGMEVPYKTGRVHQHVGEIEQFLGGASIYFSPALGPFFRGIIATCALPNTNDTTTEALVDYLKDYYAEHELVQILPVGEKPAVENVVGTDRCDIGAVATMHTIEITSCIDNLRKGAAGQAVQTFNILRDVPETTGLNL